MWTVCSPRGTGPTRPSASRGGGAPPCTCGQRSVVKHRCRRARSSAARGARRGARGAGRAIWLRSFSTSISCLQDSGATFSRWSHFQPALSEPLLRLPTADATRQPARRRSLRSGGAAGAHELLRAPPPSHLHSCAGEQLSQKGGTLSHPSHHHRCVYRGGRTRACAWRGR
jgi:hypothetical protein